MRSVAPFVAAGAVIFALRASFVLSAGRVALPASARRLLVHARPAVLAALAASVVTTAGSPVPDWEALAVGVVALVVSRRLGMVGTVVAGLATVALLSVV